MVTHMDLVIGSRVRLTHNLHVEGGLYNGQMGPVYGFVYQGNGPCTDEEYMPRDFGILKDSEREQPIILVQIDGDLNYSCSQEIPNLVPIIPIEGRCLIGKDYKRWQYPILLAHARTGHSIQGFTSLNGIVVDLGSPFFGGDYVALGRATSLLKILLTTIAQTSHFTSHAAYRLQVEQFYAHLEEIFPQ